MIYREFRPSPALHALVDRLWWLEGPAELIGAEPIPPDGRTEIIVHGADAFAARDGSGGWHVQDRVLLAGQATHAVAVRPRGYARLVGARLHPTGAFAFFGVPQDELTDSIAELRVIDSRLARTLRDDVATRENGSEMITALDRALVKAAPAQMAVSPVNNAVALALGRRGLMKVSEMAGVLDLSARQLERVFREQIGLRPKLFLRVLRFQEVLRSLRDGSQSTWADVAARHGFYDQAHFIRDFKEFVGESPGAWNIGPESLAALFSSIKREREVSTSHDVQRSKSLNI
jgi:AraC-like DNA-binding protein